MSRGADRYGASLRVQVVNPLSQCTARIAETAGCPKPYLRRAPVRTKTEDKKACVVQSTDSRSDIRVLRVFLRKCILFNATWVTFEGFL